MKNIIFIGTIGCGKTTLSQAIKGEKISYKKTQAVEVVGGKTGTTSEAGACLVLLSKNKYGNPYVTVIMKEPDKDSLYQEMNQLLGKINEK